MFFVLFFAILTAQINEGLALYCEKEWTAFGDNCYWKSNDKVTWRENTMNCASLDASMAIIKTEDENNFIKNFIGESDFYWTGAFFAKLGDRAGIGYRWVTGPKITYTDWYNGKPTHNDGYYCVTIHPQNQWLDINCDEQLKQLCQKPGQLQPITEKTTTTTIEYDFHTTETEDDDLRNMIPKYQLEIDDLKGKIIKYESDIKNLTENKHKCEANIKKLNCKLSKCGKKIKKLSVKNK